MLLANCTIFKGHDILYIYSMFKNVLTKSICIPNTPKLKFICSIKDEYSNVNDVYQNSKLTI